MSKYIFNILIFIDFFEIYLKIKVDINQDKMKSADFIDGFIYSMCRSCLETDDRFNLKSLLKRIPLLCVIITEELEFEAADTFKGFIIQYNLLSWFKIYLNSLFYLKYLNYSNGIFKMFNRLF
jgi:hypothetical protein